MKESWMCSIERWKISVAMCWHRNQFLQAGNMLDLSSKTLELA